MATELQQTNREDPNCELSWPSFKLLSSNDIHALPHAVSMNRPKKCRYCKNPASITAKPGGREAGHAQTRTNAPSEMN